MQAIRWSLLWLLAFLDLEYTKRKIAELGVEVELNPLIRKLVSMLGVEYGTDLGVIVPTALVAWAGWYNPNLLSFVLGMRFLLFLWQLKAGYGK